MGMNCFVKAGNEFTMVSGYIEMKCEKCSKKAELFTFSHCKRGVAVVV